MRTSRIAPPLRKPAALLLALAATLAAQPQQIRIHAGEASPIAAPGETAAFVRDATARTIKIDGPVNHGLSVHPTASGELAVTASLATPPGDYTLEVTAYSESGEARTIRLAVTLNPVRAVPSGSTRPPVILLNGYQFLCNASPTTRDAFGDLETTLISRGAPIVYFFDNCAEQVRTPIEDLGAALGQALDALRYDNGAPVQQVDVVGHSMGGLIVRSYLAGLRTDGSVAPPANPRIRKFVQIATPNFGSYFAAAYSTLLNDVQARAMLPGSSFLWNLATWNQWADDLRGVDTIAIAGNRGIAPLPTAGDGIVSLTSASLNYAREPARTRILNYCHTEIPSLLALVARVDCTGPSITKAAETATIVASFLEDTAEWRSNTLSQPANANQYLSQFTGVHLRVQNAAGDFVNATAVTFGSLQLSLGAIAAYAEFIRGADVLRATTPGGPVECGSLPALAGTFAIVRCKAGPLISSVGSPTMTSPLGRVIVPDFPFAIRGSGFGAQRCAACTATLGGAALPITAWTDTAIIATAPASTRGRAEIAVRTDAGVDRTNIVAAVPSIATDSVTNGASFLPAFAPNAWTTIFGLNLSRTTRIWTGADIVNGALPTSLDGVSVRINGRPAYIYFVSPGQLNVLAPAADPDIADADIVSVEVTAPDGIVRTSGFRQRRAPASFLVGRYAAAVNIDGSVAAPAGAIPGVFTRPARPGDVLALYVTGLGSATTPSVEEGRVVSTPATLNDAVTVTVGAANATVPFSGLVSPGLYQINFTVPSGLTGDQPVAIRTANTPGQNTGLISLVP